MTPLRLAGHYEDAESGWAYNRFRYYSPTLGAYNAQDPLGLAPRLASAQGYVDHAAFWVDVLGLKCHGVSLDELKAAGVPAKDRSAVQALAQRKEYRRLCLLLYGQNRQPDAVHWNDQ